MVHRAKYCEEKCKIEVQLMKLSKQVSDLEKVTDVAIEFCVELPKKWLFGDYHTK